MKIGIITFHRSTNYGAQLQAYALRRFLCLAGHDASVIDYWPAYRLEREQLFSLSELRELKATAKLVYILTRLLTCIRFLKRRHVARTFAEKHLNNTPSFGGSQKGADSFDVVVYGSDQIWRKFQRTTFKGYDPVYFGYESSSIFNIQSSIFKVVAKRRITYAASMGPVAFDNESDKAFFKKSMQNFNAISVRESGLQAMLAEEFAVTAAKVCDPTLLLSREEWSALIDSRQIPKQPYILYYRLNPNADADQFAERLSASMGVKVLEMRGKIPVLHYGRRYRLTADPVAFLSMLSGAQCVVSTSFHGVALSIRLQKQFYFVSKEKNANRAMSLLAELGLQHRRVTDWRNHSLDNQIDYSNCENKLNEMTSESACWLLSNIE